MGEIRICKKLKGIQTASQADFFRYSGKSDTVFNKKMIYDLIYEMSCDIIENMR